MKHLSPSQSWSILQSNPSAVLIDVRMEIESLYVGRPPKSINIPWYEFPNFEPDPAAFIAAVEREVPKRDTPIVLLCRSGVRSATAGELLKAAGFTDLVNVVHGFEGSLDAAHHRSAINGWRFDGLPWEQL